MTLLYVYLLLAAFAGGYLLKDSIDEREEGFVDPPPVMSVVLMSMVAPIVAFVTVVCVAGGLVRDRIAR